MHPPFGHYQLQFLPSVWRQVQPTLSASLLQGEVVRHRNPYAVAEPISRLAVRLTGRCTAFPLPPLRPGLFRNLLPPALKNVQPRHGAPLQQFSQKRFADEPLFPDGDAPSPLFFGLFPKLVPVQQLPFDHVHAALHPEIGEQDSRDLLQTPTQPALSRFYLEHDLLEPRSQHAIAPAEPPAPLRLHIPAGPAVQP